MASDIDIVEGWDEPFDEQLLADGVARNITGATVAFLVYGRNEVLATHTGTASITTAATGLVRYAPVAGEFTAANSPYGYRWRVTLGGKVSYHPNKGTARLIVRKP